MVSAPGVIGKGIRIKGDLTGQGDLVIEGQVEGSIQLGSHLTIGESAIVRANIAVERVTLKSGSKVEGEIRAPSVVIEDGASFRGSIQMDVGIPEDI